jgi:hypothetical protein
MLTVVESALASSTPQQGTIILSLLDCRPPNARKKNAGRTGTKDLGSFQPSRSVVIKFKDCSYRDKSDQRFLSRSSTMSAYSVDAAREAYHLESKVTNQ